MRQSTFGSNAAQQLTVPAMLAKDADGYPTIEALQSWMAESPLLPEEVDCVTALMLKILDGKCKMGAAEKHISARLYLLTRQQKGLRLGDDMHALIVRGSQSTLPTGQAADDSLRDLIYEHRVLAETRISRMVMKTFKGRLRAEGVFPPKKGKRADSEADGDAE